MLSEYVEPRCGKFSRIFRGRRGYFLKKLVRLTHKVGIRREIMSLHDVSWVCDYSLARRDQIALLLILFERDLCVLTRLEIGANYEKDREFLNAAGGFGSLRNLSGHRF
jgi:hypothetical protein